MSQVARVESVDALREFRVALIKFAEAANGALGDSESEVQRAQMWLENDQLMHWQSQIRKRNEVVSRAKEALRMKKVFKDATGGKASYIDEEKALLKATRALEEAEQKLVATKAWARRFQKEAAAYKGSVQRLSTFVLADVPVATAKLDRMTAALQAYLALVSPEIAAMAMASSSSGTPPPAGLPGAEAVEAYAKAAPEAEPATVASSEAEAASADSDASAGKTASDVTGDVAT